MNLNVARIQIVDNAVVDFLKLRKLLPEFGPKRGHKAGTGTGEDKLG